MKQSSNGLNDNEMDDLFRVANAEANPIPSFQESYWNEMEALLPTKKRKAFFWWWLSATAAFFVGLIWIIFEVNSGNNTSSKINGARSSSMIQNEVQSKQKEQDLNADNDLKQETNTSNQQNNYLNSETNKQKLKQSVEANKSNLIHKDEPISEELHQHLTTEISPSTEMPNTDYSFVEETDKLKIEKLASKEWRTQLGIIPNLEQEVVTKTHNQPRFYSQLGLSVGQSYLNGITFKNQLVFGSTLAIGLRKQISNLELTAGLQGRIESYQNVQFNEKITSYDANGNPILVNSLTHVKQMISLEFPLSMGFHVNKHLIAWNINPGIQLFYAGNRLETVGNSPQTREKIVGAVKYSKTVTMELGASYFYSLNRNWMIGCGINADILRPFNPNYYDGNSTQFPINGQFLLRKTF